MSKILNELFDKFRAHMTNKKLIKGESKLEDLRARAKAHTERTGGDTTGKVNAKLASSIKKVSQGKDKNISLKQKLDSKIAKNADNKLTKTASKILDNERFASKFQPKTMSSDLKKKIESVKAQRTAELEKKKKVAPKAEAKPVKTEKPKVDKVKEIKNKADAIVKKAEEKKAKEAAPITEPKKS